MTPVILPPSAEAVKPRRHTRIPRAEISAPDIDPALKARARRSHPRDEKCCLRAGAPHAGTDARI